ncbi:MAG: hypothetical protein WCE68_01810 [Anaerolineales bacterium]
MQRAFLVALVLLIGISLLLSGCSSYSRTNSAGPQAQPAAASGEVQPTPSGSSLDQSVDAADQALNDLQSTLQSMDIPTPASTGDPDLDSAGQGLNGLQQTLQAEPAP